MRVLTVLGTRPEAIKLAPVIKALEKEPSITHTLCVTGQHREMLDQVLNVFQLCPTIDLGLMVSMQGLPYITSAALSGVDTVIEKTRPDWVVVQGDTTTAFSAGLAAFYRRVNVAHVEAGLRTGNVFSPWPEEANRRLLSVIATAHFPPTELARNNLLREGIPERSIWVTGNTVIDALLWMSSRLESDRQLSASVDARLSFLDKKMRLILVTGHRRENFESGLEQVCLGLAELAGRGDVEIVYPVHLNPRVREIVFPILGTTKGIHLIDPLEYAPFVALMKRAYIIVTDSGGIQEEAPALGKPVLVTRDTTERPEAIEAGTALLVGTSAAALVPAANRLLDDPNAYDAMAQAMNPFGDGTASRRIVDTVLRFARA